MKKIKFWELSYSDLPEELMDLIDSEPKEALIRAVKGTGDCQYLYIGLGERPNGGFNIRIDSVQELEGRIAVVYCEVRPDPGVMVIQVLTYPWTVIKIERSLPIQVTKAE